MKSKLIKLSIALAGIMSAAAITAVVPAGTVGTLGSVATVVHAEMWDDDTTINKNWVVNGDLDISGWCNCYIRNNSVIIVNGNVSVGNYSTLTLDSGSLLIVYGYIHLSEYANFYGGTVRLTRSLSEGGGNTVTTKIVTDPNMDRIGYVAENAEHYEYFTSNGSGYYTFNGSDFVETTEAAVSKTKPATATYRQATATYRQVGTNYDAEFSGDKQASLWKVTVTPGTDTVTSLSVKVNEKTPDAPLSSETGFSGNGGIVFGVVLNGIASDFNGNFVALVNGEAVTTTADATIE